MGKQLIEGDLNQVVHALQETPSLEGKRVRLLIVDEDELATIYAAERPGAVTDMFAEMDSHTVTNARPADVSREAMYAPEDPPASPE